MWSVQCCFRHLQAVKISERHSWCTCVLIPFGLTFKPFYFVSKCSRFGHQHFQVRSNWIFHSLIIYSFFTHDTPSITNMSSRFVKFISQFVISVILNLVCSAYSLTVIVNKFLPKGKQLPQKARMILDVVFYPTMITLFVVLIFIHHRDMSNVQGAGEIFELTKADLEVEIPGVETV